MAVDIEQLIAALSDHYEPDAAAIVERMLREYGGKIPDKQLIEEIGLALAIHRREAEKRKRPPSR